MLGSESSEALFERARELHRNQQWIEAAQCYEAILAREPENHKVLHLLGLLSHQAGDAELALDLLHKAIQLEPNEPAYYENFGSALQALNHFDVAIDAYDVAISLNPHAFQALSNRAHIHLQRGDNTLAVEDFQAAIVANPDSIESYFQLGACLEDLGKDHDAVNVYKAVIERSAGEAFRDQPQARNEMFVAASINKALCLSRLGKASCALKAIQAALAIEPDHPLANTTLAHALRDLEQHEEALKVYEKACALHQQSAEALVHLGMAYRECFDLDRAIDYYDQALLKRPHWNEAIWNKSMALLLKGDYQAGFALYESRWDRPEFRNISAATQALSCKPLLEARHELKDYVYEPSKLLAGKHLLIYAEQGYGDTLQFSRFALTAKAYGAKVYMHVPALLESLMRQLDPAIEVHSSTHVLQDLQHQVDYHVAMMSLPFALGLDEASIAKGPHHYLKPSAQALEHWHHALEKGLLDSVKQKAPHRTRVGIMWRGSSAFARNFRRRSVVLERFVEALSDLPIQLVSLQIDPSHQELMVMQQAGVVSLHDSVSSFEDTAALAMQLQAVITVDTSVAHLCGGLGVPTWVLVPHRADWRWMFEREDSPWYPSVRLLRRAQGDDGRYVLERARKAVLSELGSV